MKPVSFLWGALLLTCILTLASATYLLTVPVVNGEIINPGTGAGEKYTFSSSSLENIRNNASSLTKCPELEDSYSDEDCSLYDTEEEQTACEDKKYGWVVYPCDPTAIMGAFPHLSFSEGKKIAGFNFRELIGGNTRLSVINTGENLSLPTNKSEIRLSDTIPGGDPDIMSYVNGDKSPDSYIEASLLSRELPQIGAFWHGIDWGTHTIIDDELLNEKKGPNEGFISEIPTWTEINSASWNWTEQKPSSFNPVVIIVNDTATVQFYTFSGLHQEQIVRHTDTYTNGSYIPSSEDITLATGKSGFYF